MIFSDINLSRKIERAEAQATAAFVDARARMFPESGACRAEIGGAFALFEGVNSPSTQTLGLGMFEEATGEILDELEAFFKERETPVFHEVSPLAGVELARLLSERGYRPIEMTSVMYLDLSVENRLDLNLNPGIKTRIIEAGEEDLWAKISAEGWSNEPGMEEFGDFMYEFARIATHAEGGFPFLAELDEKPISTGSIFVHEDTALMAGASTIPAGRKQGAQTALLDARLRFAVEKGCRIAVTGATPGSQSQRNAEKNNFRIAYTRTKWMLED